MGSSDRAKQLLADALNCDAALISGDVRIGQFERWDSLAHLRLILAIEQELGRELDPDEAVRIEGLADIATLLGAARRPLTR
ncbi:MAG TPA: acyl carrier protein [Pseudolabrys sp.]|nr:acyl carrier protein [Pseudolabrys sp.]